MSMIYKIAVFITLLLIVGVACLCSPQIRSIFIYLLSQRELITMAIDTVVSVEYRAQCQIFIAGLFAVVNRTASPTGSPIDVEAARKQRVATIKALIYYNDKVPVKRSAIKAEDVMKSIQFSRYDENTLCNFMEGIPGVEFVATVEEIAEVHNMPITLKRVLMRAGNLIRRDVFSLNRRQFTTRDGYMVFGRVAVFPNGNTIDMAYSFHSVKYKLAKKQSKPEFAGNFTTFSETLNKGNDGNSNKISFEVWQGLYTHFRDDAIERFQDECDYLLKNVDNAQKEEAEGS